MFLSLKLKNQNQVVIETELLQAGIWQVYLEKLVVRSQSLWGGGSGGRGKGTELLMRCNEKLSLKHREGRKTYLFFLTLGLWPVPFVGQIYLEKWRAKEPGKCSSLGYRIEQDCQALYST